MDIMHDYWGSGMGFGMWIFWILFIAIIVVLIRMVFGTRSDASPPTRSHDTGSHDTGSQDDALEILRQRYARGEIDKNEFETMQQELNKQD